MKEETLPEPSLRVRSIRTQLGWTQKQLAEAMGTDGETVCRWENGEHEISPSYRRILESLPEVKDMKEE